jgi:hypothetical protein
VFSSSVILTGKAFQKEEGEIGRIRPNSKQPNTASYYAIVLAKSEKPNDKTKDESQF